MAIRVAAGTADSICDHADGFALEVTGASDLDLAMAALSRARTDIVALGSDGSVVSNPVLGPVGPLLRVARLDADLDTLASIPERVVERLGEAGVTEAIIGAPEPGGALDGLDSCANAVVLRLFPPPAAAAGTLPPTWLDVACEWVLGDLGGADLVPLRLLAVEYEVRVADAPAVLHQAGVARAWCDLVNGQLEDRVRTASITFGRAPHVALAAGGPGCDSSALVARFELLVEVARECAGELGYACIDVEPTFEGIGLGLAGTGWPTSGGANANRVAGQLCDVLVPDAFPYQVLGPGHLARLGPEDLQEDEPPIGDALDHGRIEVPLGDPIDWLPRYDARADAVADALEVLAPWLATEEEVAELLAGRPATGGDDHGESPGRAPGGALPDLSDITLDTVPHGRRGLRLTLLELAAWLAHEPHTDSPVSVSPVVATYARWLASSLDDDRRQELRTRAASLVGTAVPIGNDVGDGAELASTERARAWTAADWLIRVQAATWLRLAGLTEAATRLASLGPTDDHLELVRAVDVLGSAIAIAGRRIDLTSSIAGADRPDDTLLVEQAAWEAWERASEASGWVAASEASAVGIPAELAHSIDLQVIGAARDSRRRDELEAARRSLGDVAWATALHAVADEAWSAGWAAAGRAVDAGAVIPLRTARHRAERAALGRPDAGDPDGEAGLDAAESRARECLTRAALGSRSWGEGGSPWDAALMAASAGTDGAVWASMLQMTRSAVDEGPWQAGMEAARSAVDDVLRDAPDLVARAVGAAMAREAGGAAARGVALRAAAVARAQGADEAATQTAARHALTSAVADLQDDAVALLDRLVEGLGPRAG